MSMKKKIVVVLSWLKVVVYWRRGVDRASARVIFSQLSWFSSYCVCVCMWTAQREFSSDPHTRDSSQKHVSRWQKTNQLLTGGFFPKYIIFTRKIPTKTRRRQLINTTKFILQHDLCPRPSFLSSAFPHSQTSLFYWHKLSPFSEGQPFYLEGKYRPPRGSNSGSLTCWTTALAT